jgi:hypothetical protein
MKLAVGSGKNIQAEVGFVFTQIESRQISLSVASLVG